MKDRTSRSGSEEEDQLVQRRRIRKRNQLVSSETYGGGQVKSHDQLVKSELGESREERDQLVSLERGAVKRKWERGQGTSNAFRTS